MIVRYFNNTENDIFVLQKLQIATTDLEISGPIPKHAIFLIGILESYIVIKYILWTNRPYIFISINE